MKTTDRPGDTISYRCFTRVKVDAVAIGEQTGFIAEDSALSPLVSSWSSLYNGDSMQWMDFDSDKGFAKIWVNFLGPRPLADVLQADGVPETIRRHGPKFHDMGFDLLRFASVDYRHNSVNFYISAQGPVDADFVARVTALSGVTPPEPSVFADMSYFLRDDAYPLAFTISLETGAVERVCFYVVGHSGTRHPQFGDRLTRFYAEAPSYDDKDYSAIGWSFGSHGGTYMKGEHGYWGDGRSALMDSGDLVSG